MPMIDIYAKQGTFADPHRLATQAATIVKTVEQVPDIPMFRKNTAAFVHELPDAAIANVDGDSNYVRVQVLTNSGALTREKQLAVVEKLTELVATEADWHEHAVEAGLDEFTEVSSALGCRTPSSSWLRKDACKLAVSSPPATPFPETSASIAPRRPGPSSRKS